MRRNTEYVNFNIKGNANEPVFLDPNAILGFYSPKQKIVRILLRNGQPVEVYGTVEDVQSLIDKADQDYCLELANQHFVRCYYDLSYQLKEINERFVNNLKKHKDYLNLIHEEKVSNEIMKIATFYDKVLFKIIDNLPQVQSIYSDHKEMIESIDTDLRTLRDMIYNFSTANQIGYN